MGEPDWKRLSQSVSVLCTLAQTQDDIINLEKYIEQMVSQYPQEKYASIANNLQRVMKRAKADPDLNVEPLENAIELLLQNAHKAMVDELEHATERPALCSISKHSRDDPTEDENSSGRPSKKARTE